MSDEIINRLYLVGIISGNLNNNSLEIKNRIIEKSLSLEWIERIELESQGYFNIGEEKYNKGEYLESIRYFNDFIKNTKEITLNELNRTHSYLAYSYFNLKEYDLALNEYSKILYNKEKESESYYLIIFEMGACNLYLSRYEKSIKLFTEFITNPNLNYERRISAVSNIGYNLLSLNRKDEALMKFKEVELGLESFEDEEHSLNTLRLVNYKNLYICDSNNAKEYCEKAIDCAVNVKNKLHFLLKLYTLTDDVKYIDEVLDLIFIHKLSFEELTPLNIEFDVKSFYDLFAITYFLNHRFDEISKYFLERDNIIYVEFLYSVAIYVVNNDFSTKKIKIILLDIANYENDLISENTKYIIVDVFRRLCIIFHNDKNESKFIQFARKFALVFEGDNSKITNADVFIFFHLSQKMLFSNSNGADIIYFLSIIENKIDIDNMDLNIMCNYIFILFIFIQTYINSKNKKEAEEYAVKLLNIVKKVKHQANKVDISQYNSILSMEESAKRVLNPQIKPLIVPKKYGRNDIVTVQYTDGNIQHGKYKKFEEDILKYICVII